MPKKRCFIIASNHVSHLDPLAIGSFIRGKMNYIGKKELFSGRFLDWYMRRLRIIPIDRNTPIAGMKEVIETIKKGYPLLIFPEGTRGDGKTFLEPEKGVGYLAVKYNLPVVSAYVKGTTKGLPKGSRFIRPTPVSVYYGPARTYILPEGVDKDRFYSDVSHRIMDEIKALKEKYDP